MTQDTKLKIGDKAPDFVVEIDEGQKISLQDLAGKFVILYFYPKDNTPGCTLEAQQFNQLLAEFEQLNAKIIGVSKDNLASHAKFKNLFNLNFDLAADSDCRLCQAYGVWVEKSMFGKKYMGIERATFLINPAGKIAYIWPKVKVTEHASSVLAKLREIAKIND